MIERCVKKNISIDKAKASLPNEVFLHYESKLNQSQPQDVGERFKFANETWPEDGGAICSGPKIYNSYLASFCTVRTLEWLNDENSALPIGPTSHSDLKIKFKKNAHAARNLVSANLLVNPDNQVRKEYWLTDRQFFNSVIENSRYESHADIAKAVLGLSHFPRGSNVVCFEFPVDYVDSYFIPTFVDGGAHMAYCSWPESDARYGFTWRLDTQAKGIPEVVIEEHLLDGSAKLFFSYLGVTMADDLEPDPQAILNR